MADPDTLLLEPRGAATLNQLMSALPQDEVLTPGAFDGYLAGVIISPKRVTDEQWLPQIWGGAEQAFPGDPARCAGLIEQILARKAEIATELLAGDLAYQPLFDFDKDGEAVWETWITGFMYAASRCGTNWKALVNHRNEDLATAALGMVAYAAMARGVNVDEIAGINAVKGMMAAGVPPTMLLPYFAETIHRCQNGRRRIPMVAGWDEPVRKPKIGRNEPCPCGSGKKYKKCCGAN